MPRQKEGNMESAEIIEIKIDRKELSEMLQKRLYSSIEEMFMKRGLEIHNAVEKLFQKELLKSDNRLENEISWCLEMASRKGVERATEEYGLEEKVCKITKDMLEDDSIILELAKKQISKSLGL